MDQRTLDKILDYNRLKKDADEIQHKLWEARKNLLADIAEIANKAGLNGKDLEDAVIPF